MAIVIVRTLIVYFALVLFMRLMGKRQLGELELPELAVAVLIADLAAHPLQDIGIPLMNGLLPVAVLFCCEVLISGVTMKSSRARSLLYGRPAFLIRKGVIDQGEMRRCRFTIDELTEELRGQGVTDIAQVEYAVLETNGVLNTLLFPEFQPASARDLGLKPAGGGYAVVLIDDGRVMEDNLRYMGRDRRWLLRELAQRGAHGAEQVYIFALDECGRIYYAAKEADA